MVKYIREQSLSGIFLLYKCEVMLWIGYVLRTSLIVWFLVLFLQYPS